MFPILLKLIVNFKFNVIMEKLCPQNQHCNGIKTLTSAKQNKAFCLFRKRNLLKLFTLLIVFLSLFLPLTSSGQTDLTNCYGSCTSGDFTINKAFLAKDAAGTPLTSADCSSPGAMVNVYLCFTFENTTNSNRTGMFISAKLNGVPFIHCFGGVLPKNTLTTFILPNPFIWNCGSSISLTNVFIGWGSAGEDVCANACNQVTPSKCRNVGNQVVNTPLQCSVVQNSPVKCFGGSNGSATVTPTGGSGGYTYLWDNGATTATVNNLNAGLHSVTVNDNSGSMTTCDVTITQPATALALGTCSATGASCNGGNTGSVIAGAVTNSVGAVIYSWKNAANVEVGTTATVNNLPAGTYTLTVKDDCFTRTCTVTIGQPAAALALGACSKTDVICFGASTGSVTAGAVTNAVGAVSYSWKNAANVEVGTTTTVNNLPAGTYTLTVKDDCFTRTCTVTIGQPAAALALAACTATGASCNGGNTGSVIAGVVTNSVGAVSYSWKNAANVEVGTTATVNNLPAGTYTLTVKDDCFTRTCTVTIGQPAAALALAACSATDVKCFGASTGSVVAGVVTNSVGAVSYSWKNAANVEVGTTATVNNLPAGTYTLTVKDDCFTRTCSVTIGQPAAALSLGTCSKTNATCNGPNTGSVIAGVVTNSVGAVSYSWKMRRM